MLKVVDYQKVKSRFCLEFEQKYVYLDVVANLRNPEIKKNHKNRDPCDFDTLRLILMIMQNQYSK